VVSERDSNFDFIGALIKRWLLLENSVSRSLSNKINFGYVEFRWCSFFHEQFDCPYLHRIWSKVEFVGICPKFLCRSRKQLNYLFSKIVTWHSRLKLWMEIFYFTKIILFSYFEPKILFNFEKTTLDSQDTYLQLGLLLSTFRAST